VSVFAAASGSEHLRYDVVVSQGQLDRLILSVERLNTVYERSGLVSERAGVKAAHGVDLAGRSARRSGRDMSYLADKERLAAEHGRRLLRHLAGIAGVFAGGLGLVGAAQELEDIADATRDQQNAQAGLEAQLQALGLSTHAYGDEIERVVNRQSALAKIDDEDVKRSLTILLRATGNLTDAYKLNALALDIARARHMDAAHAAAVVAKVYGGNVGAARRLGIVLEKNISPMQALVELDRQFADQAVRAGSKPSEAFEGLHITIKNLKEELGAGLLPEAAKAANVLQRELADPAVQQRLQQIGHTIGHDVVDGLEKTASFVEQHWPEIQSDFRIANQLLQQSARFAGLLSRSLQDIADVAPGGSNTVAGAILGGYLASKALAADAKLVRLIRRLRELRGVAVATEAAGAASGAVGGAAAGALGGAAGGLAGAAGAKMVVRWTKTAGGGLAADLVPAAEGGAAATAARAIKLTPLRVITPIVIAFEIQGHREGIADAIADAVKKATGSGTLGGAAGWFEKNIGLTPPGTIPFLTDPFNGLFGHRGHGGREPRGPGDFLGTMIEQANVLHQKLEGVRGYFDANLANLETRIRVNYEETKKKLDELVKKERQAVKEAFAAVTERANAAFDANTDRLLQGFDDRTDSLLQAFDDQTQRLEEHLTALVKVGGQSFRIREGGKTPAERELEALDKLQRKRQEQRDLEDARTALATASDIGDPKAIADAKRQLQDARAEVRRNRLEDRAARERAAADKALEEARRGLERRRQLERRALDHERQDERRSLETSRQLQRDNLDQQLRSLEKAIQSGKVKTGEAQSRLVSLLKSYGVEYKDAGSELGKAFTDGLGKSIDQAIRQVQKLDSALDRLVRLKKRALEQTHEVRQRAGAARQQRHRHGEDRDIGFAGGGVAGWDRRPPGPGDDILAWLKRNEIVLDDDHQRALARVLGVTGGPRDLFRHIDRMAAGDGGSHPGRGGGGDGTLARLTAALARSELRTERRRLAGKPYARSIANIETLVNRSRAGRLPREQRVALMQKLSQEQAHPYTMGLLEKGATGVTLGPRGRGHGGGSAAGGGGDAAIYWSGDLVVQGARDPRRTARAVRSELNKQRKRGTAQRRGRHPGVNIGAA
jgi:hypothetical protein